ncbi:MAG: hypothetical protein CVV02_17640 [Firmicutes bacterium HGW-Firmicutes-7]|nr:MAG: hypothetical protein CVV02_17640 [Firmicutes bacterium HGW-Firmicutes-7]
MNYNFAERYGYVEVKVMQYESMDDDLRMRLLNFVLMHIRKVQDSYEGILLYLAKEYFLVSIDRYSYEYEEMIKNEILNENWYKVYSFIEFVMKLIVSYCIKYKVSSKPIIDELNRILEVEKAGYKYFSNLIVPITNEEELNSINQTINSKYDSVNKHISKALQFYSNRENPDYENSIKESISGVEAICCIIVGKDNAVLSSALDRLKSNGVKIHQAQIEAFKKLYGYTSDENGIRHAGIEFVNASFEDAKFMLISCSSFINYLIVKYEKTIVI